MIFDLGLADLFFLIIESELGANFANYRCTDMESFAFPDMIKLTSTEIRHKCIKFQFFSLESLSILGIFSKGKA